MNNKRKLVKRL